MKLLKTTETNHRSPTWEQANGNSIHYPIARRITPTLMAKEIHTSISENGSVFVPKYEPIDECIRIIIDIDSSINVFNFCADAGIEINGIFIEEVIKYLNIGNSWVNKGVFYLCAVDLFFRYRVPLYYFKWKLSTEDIGGFLEYAHFLFLTYVRPARWIYSSEIAVEDMLSQLLALTSTN